MTTKVNIDDKLGMQIAQKLGVLDEGSLVFKLSSITCICLSLSLSLVHECESVSISVF